MTDYRRWDCFDPDTAIEELDKKEALLDAKIQRRRDEESELKSTERTLLEVKTAAEIANTKVRKAILPSHSMIFEFFSLAYCIC